MAIYTAKDWALSAFDGEKWVGVGEKRIKFKSTYNLIPETPYLVWFVKIGCADKKNKMPRGKKFQQAIKPYQDGKYSIRVKPNPFLAGMLRAAYKPILFDEMDKFNN